MTIKLLRTEAAMSWLQDQPWGQRWDALSQQCPWATPFQSRAFATTWYEVYAERYDPLIVIQTTTEGQLTGLLLLAIEKKAGELVGAGTHHAEYQVWLSLPKTNDDTGDEFILAALEQLRPIFPTQEIFFKYLPPATPLTWHKSERLRGTVFELQSYQRPLLKLGDGSAIAESLKKKSNKSRLNRLKQAGKISNVY